MADLTKEELRKLFEEYKQREDVRLWIREASKHAFRVWSDGYKEGLRVGYASGVRDRVPAQPNGGA